MAPNCTWCSEPATHVRSIYSPKPKQEWACKEHVWTKTRGSRKSHYGVGRWIPLCEANGLPRYNCEYVDFLHRWVAYCDDFRYVEEIAKTKAAALRKLLAEIKMSLGEGGRTTEYTSGWAASEIHRKMLPKEAARKNLTEARDILTALLDCKDDQERAHLFRRLQFLVENRWDRNMSPILLWSQMINDPTYTRVPKQK